ncbi:hypothetical protein PFPBOIHM_00022 [Aeromonas phage avDM11-UST]|nr:hypothetical protein PFPBOIHM_00022 [Aeromonas phage avDM11-UST]
MRNQRQVTTYRNAPDDKDFPSNPHHGLCSDWCYRQWEAALNQGDQRAADAYMTMHEMWKERNQ